MLYHELMHEAKQEFDAWDPILQLSERLCWCGSIIHKRSPHYASGVCRFCRTRDAKGLPRLISRTFTGTDRRRLHFDV